MSPAQILLLVREVDQADGGRTDACQKLALLGLKYPDQAEIRFFDRSYDNAQEASDIAELLFVTHPVVLLDSSGMKKAFWLERFHFPESSVAMDVSYVSPADVEKSKLVEKYTAKLMFIMARTVAATQIQLESLIVSEELTNLEPA